MLKQLTSSFVATCLDELGLNPSLLRAAVKSAARQGNGTLEAILLHQARESSAEFIQEYCPNALIFSDGPDSVSRPTQPAIRTFTANLAKSSSRPISFLEFGVWEGKSIRFFASALPAETNLVGFDSFEGLSTDWAGTDFAKGALSTNGRAPQNLPQNVEIVVGQVEETLSNWLSHNGLHDFVVVHCDLDIFEPTLYVLQTLRAKLRPGSLILFDNYFSYPGWKNGEHKALMESGIEHEFLAVSASAAPGGSDRALVQIR